MTTTTLSPDQLVAIHAEGILQRGTSPFENPATMNMYQDVITRRGEEWAASVLGRNLARRSLTWGPWLEQGEPEILILADERETAASAASAPALPVFDSLEQFYTDRPERARSGESDYGVHWCANGQNWPRFRVSYVQATGEVYAFRQAGREPGAVRVLGIVPPDPDSRFSTGDWDGGTYYRTLDRILDGWADPDVSGHDLAWVERKLTEWAGGAR